MTRCQLIVLTEPEYQMDREMDGFSIKIKEANQITIQTLNNPLNSVIDTNKAPFL